MRLETQFACRLAPRLPTAVLFSSSLSLFYIGFIMPAISDGTNIRPPGNWMDTAVPRNKCPVYLTGINCDAPNPCHLGVGRSRCYNNGTCEPKWQGPPSYPGAPLWTFDCRCKPGYNGTLCDSFTHDNACRNNDTQPFRNPCVNFSTCRLLDDTPSKYTCDCRKGFAGRHCEWNDLCAKCMNNATCTQYSHNTYKCKCAPGYKGHHCQTAIDECAARDNECVNGGVCHDIGGGTTYCVCPENKFGGHCQFEDVCVLRNPCPTLTRCVVNRDSGSHECKCRAGFHTHIPPHCVDYNECNDAGRCSSRGKCFNTFGSFRCECDPGYAGTQCQIDIDECAWRPCLNGAECVNEIAAFECRCPHGFVGKRCEINVDECDEQPCTNDGVCVDGVGDFYCKCATGFGGKTCEIDLDDECYNEPCKNGGTCLDKVGKFSCVCTNGYMGPTCEEVDVLKEEFPDAGLVTSSSAAFLTSMHRILMIVYQVHVSLQVTYRLLEFFFC